MELSAFLRSALTPASLKQRLQLLKAEKVFGESLCYSQLLSIQEALEDATEHGWDGIQEELASVQDVPMVVLQIP